jgi:hypothetical protein
MQKISANTNNTKLRKEMNEQVYKQNYVVPVNRNTTQNVYKQIDSIGQVGRTYLSVKYVQCRSQ